MALFSITFVNLEQVFYDLAVGDGGNDRPFFMVNMELTLELPNLMMANCVDEQGRQSKVMERQNAMLLPLIILI